MKHQLDFEKPITELQNKLEELRSHPEKHSLGISFEDEIQIIERKIEETRRQIFLNLNAWQRVQLARHPKRPYTLDYFHKTFSDFQELHGDRMFAEDHAMVGGFAKLGEHRVVVIGTQKGRDTGKYHAQLRFRASRRLPQGTPAHAARQQIRPAHHHDH